MKHTSRQLRIASLVVMSVLSLATLLHLTEESSESHELSLPTRKPSTDMVADAPDEAVPLAFAESPVPRPRSRLRPPKEGALPPPRTHELLAEEPQRKAAWTDGSDTAILVRPDYVHVLDKQGRLIAEGEWRDERKEGYWQYYDETGAVCLAGSYVGGLSDGLWIQRGPNGSIIAEANTKAGKFHGVCRFYDDRGARSGVYREGERIDALDD